MQTVKPVICIMFGAILALVVAVNASIAAEGNSATVSNANISSKNAKGPASKKERVVLQVSDDNPKTWNQALNVIENLQEAYGKENIDIKLVGFGLGLGILKLDSVAGGRVEDALKSGARIIACENTMRRRKLTKDDMLPNIEYVAAGIIEVIKSQQQGWTVNRP